MKKTLFETQRPYLEKAFGIHMQKGAQYVGRDGLAMDAQSVLITAPNSSIPFQFSNFIFPDTIKTLTAPMASTQVADEEKLGDWTMTSAEFPRSEYTGTVSAYGDFDETGAIGANFNWEPRKSFHVQTITRWGDRESEMYGIAGIKYAAELNEASTLRIAKFHNKAYIYGVTSVSNNYGLINDPALPAATAPTTKAAGNANVWTFAGSPNATPIEIYNDFLALYTQLVTQLLGQGMEADNLTKMKWVMPTLLKPALHRATPEFITSAWSTIKEQFPNVTIVSVPEYATGSGNLMQLIVEEIEGVKTVTPFFTEKMRAGPVIQGLSSYSQKKTAGTWGSVWKRPIACAQGIGY